MHKIQSYRSQASSGPVLSDLGGLMVAAVSSPDQVVGKPLADVHDLLPGSMASNSANTGARQAVVLGRDSTVTGDVRSRGDVRLVDGARVLGEVRRGEDAVDIPTVPIARFDPKAQGKPITALASEMTSPSVTTPITVSGYCRYSNKTGPQAMHVYGDLKLDGAVVFVEGDLVVHGAILGKGAVFVTGTTEVQRGVRMSAENVVAVAGQGGVTIRGTGRESSAFQGLVYTEGDFTAENVSLLGSFIANGQSGQQAAFGSTMRLNNADLVYAPQYTRQQIQVKVTRQTTTSTPVATPSRVPEPTPPRAEDVVQPFLSQEFTATTTLPTRTGPPVSVRLRVPVSFLWNGSEFINKPISMAATPDFFIVDGVQGRAGYERVATRLKRGFDASALLGPLPSRVSTLNTQYQAAWTSAMSTYQSQLAAAQAANQDASQPSPTTTTTVTYEPFEFDINKFLHTQDQLKVLMWKELPQ